VTGRGIRPASASPPAPLHTATTPGAQRLFQEAPELFNARVDAFWRGVEASG